jgi:hypothetical protein
VSESEPSTDNTPKASNTESSEPQELPNSVSYLVIAAVVAGLGAYAWWTSTQVNETHVKWNQNGQMIGEDDPIPVGVNWPMEPSLVNLEDIILLGIPRDGTRSLDEPKTIPMSEAKIDGRMRVVGVSIDGKSRAYPLNLLLHHEVINDELGGVPIAVTLSPPSETATVYDRRVGGETVELGVSGRLYFSNTLLFDRRQSETEESLWRQYDGKAITGPAAGDKKQLVRMDSIVTSWARWQSLHPEADTLSEDTGHTRDYKINPHAESYTSEVTSFPLPKPTGRRPKMKQKDHVLVLNTGGASKAYFLDDLRAIKGTMVEDKVGSSAIKIGYPKKALEVEGPEDIVRFQSYWLAVDALSPSVELWNPNAKAGTAGAEEGGTGETGPDETGGETGDETTGDSPDDDGAAPPPPAKAG